jgi:hypothetical protein
MWFNKKRKVKTIKDGRNRKPYGKTSKVLTHLELNGSITSMEAFQEYNANIITKETYASNDSGYTYATYYLKEN